MLLHEMNTELIIYEAVEYVEICLQVTLGVFFLPSSSTVPRFSGTKLLQ